MTTPPDPAPPADLPPVVPPADPPPAAADPLGPPDPTPIPEKRALSTSLGQVRKFITAVIGVIAIALTQGLIEGTAAKWAGLIVGFATAAGVYIVPNEKPTGAPK